MDAEICTGKVGERLIQLEILQMTRSDLVKGRQSIDDRIRICVSCGSILVTIEGDLMSCKSCGSQFKFRGGIHGFRV